MIHRDKMEHAKALIDEHTKRLHVLELQQAQYGARVDPQIVIEIKEIKERIDIEHKKIHMLLEAETLHHLIDFLLSRSLKLAEESEGTLVITDEMRDLGKQVTSLRRKYDKLMSKYRSM